MTTPDTPPAGPPTGPELTDEDLSRLATQAAAERACVVYWSPTGTRYAPELLAGLIAAARREKKLRVALMPFAGWAERVTDAAGVGQMVEWADGDARCVGPTAGDFRRARAALED